MKNLPLLLSCLAALPSLLHANGGGYLRGGLAKSGNVELFEPSGTDQVAILDEELIITPRPQSAAVKIRYQMKNVTDKSVKVEFGFPVEELKQRNLYQAEGKTTKSPAPKLEYCRNYHIAISDAKAAAADFRPKPLPTKTIPEPRLSGISVPKVEGWIVSQASFAAGEEKTITISYDSDYPRDVSWISSRGNVSPGIFNYRLSTGACWEGTIRHGRIIIEPWEFLDPRELRVLKPVNRFEKVGKNWVWEFKDLEPTLADDLLIELEPAISTFEFTGADGITDRSKQNAQRGERWEMAHTNYKVTASSTLPPEGRTSYEADQIKGWSCWVEGAPGKGEGEWLELRPDVPSVLRAIQIRPGFARSNSTNDKAELFKANARPKRARVQLNGEKVYEIDFEDKSESQRFFLPDYTEPVEKIKITFLEVYPGASFEDLCVSRIELVSGLSKAPKMGVHR